MLQLRKLGPPLPQLPPASPPPEQPSSEKNLIYGVVAAACAAILFGALLMGFVWHRKSERIRRKEKAEQMGLQMPQCKWRLGPGKKYAAFLSHFKAEAASARHAAPSVRIPSRFPSAT